MKNVLFRGFGSLAGSFILIFASCEEKAAPSQVDEHSGLPITDREEGEALKASLRKEFQGQDFDFDVHYGEHILVVISGFSAGKLPPGIEGQVKTAIRRSKVNRVDVIFTVHPMKSGRNQEVLGRLTVEPLE